MDTKQQDTETRLLGTICLREIFPALHFILSEEVDESAQRQPGMGLALMLAHDRSKLRRALRELLLTETNKKGETKHEQIDMPLSHIPKLSSKLEE